MADVGARTTAEVVGRLETEADAGGLEGGEALSGRLTELLADLARPGEGRIDLTHEPTVIMVAGVNGTGKTTTIGKLAWHLQRELGKTVVLGAADTFRAAAVEQLDQWAQRAGCEIVTGPEGSDPGAVAFEAVEQGRERGADVIIVDTAGRLHTQDHLMAELDQGPPRDRQAARGRAARDAADHRRHHGPERRAPGAAVLRGGRRSTASC